MNGWTLQDLLMDARNRSAWNEIKYLSFHKQDVGAIEESYFIITEDISVSSVSDVGID